MENKCILISQKEYDDLKDEIKELKNSKELKGVITINSSYNDKYGYPEIYLNQCPNHSFKLSDGSISKIRKILKHFINESYQKGVDYGKLNPSEKTINDIKQSDVIKLCNFIKNNSVWSLYIFKKTFKNSWNSGCIIIKHLIFNEK